MCDQVLDSHTGRPRRDAKAGDILRGSISAGTFKFPRTPSTPLVLVGLGTGIAPLRAIIQERQWHREKGNHVGPVWLFYGCRHEKKDFLFGEEFEKLRDSGLLTHLVPAFSRDQEEKVYVQDRIRQSSQRLYPDLVEGGGFLYLCGQAGPAETSIKEAVYTVISEGRKVSLEEARVYFEEEFVKKGRYSSEIY